MKVRIARLAVAILTLAALPAMAQQTPPRPAKAPLPTKPPTATAVNKPTLGPASGPAQHGIIFVGGAQQNNGAKAALNPQPIPPGHALSTPGPKLSTGYSSLNTQPIPPGHALSTPGPQLSTGYSSLNTQPIPPGHANVAPARVQ